MNDNKRGYKDGLRDAINGDERRLSGYESLSYSDGYEKGYVKGLERAVRAGRLNPSILVGEDDYLPDPNEVELQVLENNIAIRYERVAREDMRLNRIRRQHQRTRQMIKNDRQFDAIAGSQWPRERYGL